MRTTVFWLTRGERAPAGCPKIRLVIGVRQTLDEPVSQVGSYWGPASRRAARKLRWEEKIFLLIGGYPLRDTLYSMPIGYVYDLKPPTHLPLVAR